MLGTAASFLVTAGALGAAMWLCLVAALTLVHDIRGVPEARGEAGEPVVVGRDRVDHVGEEPHLRRELAGEQDRRQDLPAEPEPGEGHARPIGHGVSGVSEKLPEPLAFAESEPGDAAAFRAALNGRAGSAPGGRT